MVTKYGTSLVSRMYKLKDSLLFDEIDSDHPFFLWYSHYFKGALESILISRALCLFHNTCCSHPL